MNLSRIFALSFISLGLVGCGENPLLGTWKAKPGQNQLFIACPEITFTKKISKCGGIVEEVDYDVQGNTVIVSSELGDKLGVMVAYEIKDRNTMTVEIPMAGKLVYGRSSY